MLKNVIIRRDRLKSFFEISPILEKTLDSVWLRNEIIAENLANVDTPGYKSKEVVFEQILRNEMMKRGSKMKIARTHPLHITNEYDVVNIKPEIRIKNNSSLRNDKNNVDIDLEMAELTKNTLKYDVLSQLIKKHFQNLQSVISEGRR
ncbi:MAG: flagellar basal-body rod protein FlgB [Thermosediminibacterales bacterium]|nr:flagellar basal-body rod protein FlgB [Thermosediminibacterales bacterium]